MFYLMNNQDITQILMVGIFIFLCSSIALIIILSFFKEKERIKKKESPEKILEFVDLNMKDENRIEVLPKEEKTRAEKEKIELDILLAKMREDLAKKETDVIRTFEEEQEEKSIISYQELLKKNKKEEPEILDVEVFPTTSLEPSYTEETHLEPTKEEHKKFRTSEFISPIYGRVQNEVEYPKIHLFEENKKEITAEKIDHEIEKGEQFLKELKEFRKNLE